MAFCVLRRRVPRLHVLPGLKVEFSTAEHLPGLADDAVDEQERMGALSKSHWTSLLQGHKLHYNPAAYHRFVKNPTMNCNHTDRDEGELTPSFWQQCNRYTMNCSWRYSTTANALLDLATNKATGLEILSRSSYHTESLPSNAIHDPRAVFRCRPEYASRTVDLNQRPSEIPLDAAMLLLKDVKILRHRRKLSDAIFLFAELSRLHPEKQLFVTRHRLFTMLLRYSVENLSRFNDFQLLEVLRSFVWLDMASSHRVLDLYEAELSRRFGTMSLHQMLFAADLWRCIGRKAPKLLPQLCDSVHLHITEMGPSELVQLFYIIGEGRQCPEKMVGPLEKGLMRNLQKLEPEEIGVICLAIFKSSIPASEAAITALVDKAHSVFIEMSDYAIVNVFKLLRGNHLYHHAWLDAMAQDMPRRAPNMAVQGLMHVLLGCSALHFRNDRILHTVAERVPSLIADCRLKDTSKLLWAFGTMAYQSNPSLNLYRSLTDSLRQTKSEFLRYPYNFLTGLLGLAFVAEFPEDLLALALSPEFVGEALKSAPLQSRKDLFTLDGTVALELPHWNGPRLSKKLRKEVTEMLWKFIQSDILPRPEFAEAEFALQELLGGERFVRKGMILPHTRTFDLEVHLDSSGNPLPVHPISSDTGKDDFSNLKRNQGLNGVNMGVTLTDDLVAQLFNNKKSAPTPDPPSDSSVKLAIQVTRKSHFFHQSQQLVGLHNLKRRQLKLMGYTVVELGYQEWSQLLRKSRTEKLAFVQGQILSSLDSFKKHCHK